MNGAGAPGGDMSGFDFSALHDVLNVHLAGIIPT